MSGWIKINRSINNHWIFKDPIKFKWWIDILLMANYEAKRVSIGYKVFECKRGECLMSLKSWGERWGVSKTVVNNFFSMLESDNMIKTVNETVTTRLLVCNYDSYQQIENGIKTESKHNQKTTLTISVEYDTDKLNKIIKIFEKENQDYVFELKKMIPEILDRFIELYKYELNGNKNQIDI
jgi:DNA-binding transcriptional regulator YhcF (GntR family)